MSRKRKRGKPRWLTLYKLFGIHLLLFLISLATLAVAGLIISGGLTFAVFDLLVSWLWALYLHTGFVILVTIYRLLRRLLYDQPKAERLRDEKLDRLLSEVAALRQDVSQRSSAPYDIQSQPLARAGRLEENLIDVSDEWDLMAESQTETQFHHP